MHRYVVAATQADGPAVALCDERGRFHVARAAAASPPFGARLTGNPPALGFGLLLGEPFDQVYRVIFESVHCSHEEAMQSLHGALGP
jgi:hypothetical protein